MKNSLRIIFLILIISSCKNQSRKELTKPKPEQNKEITVQQKAELTKSKLNPNKNIDQEGKSELTGFTIKEIDSLYNNGILTKVFYPNMSACGGALYGFYYDNELILIDSKYGAELGFSSKKIYWNENKILKIKYREYFAEWEKKYKKKYPKDEWDESKMTYSDTIYKITFGDEYEFKKMADEKIISTKTDSTLIKKLTDCGKRMKMELESINK